jgi:hypothetical protein
MTAANWLVPGAEQLSLLPADEVPVVGPWCQRWQPGRRQQTWRHRSEGGFDPARYHVRPVEEATAARFVTANHYSGAYPAARLRYGMFHGQALVGVAVLSVPMSTAVLTGVWPGLVPFDESLELGRFLLLDAVEAPAESWFLARVLRQAAAQGIRGIVTFADVTGSRSWRETSCWPARCLLFARPSGGISQMNSADSGRSDSGGVQPARPHLVARARPGNQVGLP